MTESRIANADVQRRHDGTARNNFLTEDTTACATNFIEL